MYEAPRLIKYGQFRDLTLQTAPGCQLTFPYTGKNVNTYDALFPTGQNDGCPRS